MGFIVGKDRGYRRSYKQEHSASRATDGLVGAAIAAIFV
jgi:hypothetical protein